MFTLSISMSADRLDTIKRELTRKLPDVKSSHLREGVARGLGLEAYPSAQAELASFHPGKVQICGDRFAAYLKNHGFNVSPKEVYHAAAKVALRDVADLMPELSIWGIGSVSPRREIDGRWASRRDGTARLPERRAELAHDGMVEPFLTSLAFLERVTRTKTIRHNTGSYRLKHIAENYACTYPEGEKLGPTYVPNGVLIAAARHAGFIIKTHVDSPNVSFNMSTSSLEDLECEIRRDGA